VIVKQIAKEQLNDQNRITHDPFDKQHDGLEIWKPQRETIHWMRKATLHCITLHLNRSFTAPGPISFVCV